MTPALLLLCAHALALDVLVPELTPRSVSDLDEAERITAEIVQASRNLGMDVGDPELVNARAGVGGIACADNLSCPGNLWPRFPEARLTMVGQVGEVTEGYALLVRFYAWNHPRPLDELSLTLASGAEGGVGARVAERARELLVTIPPHAQDAPIAAATPAPPVASPPTPPPPRVVIIGPTAPSEPEAPPEDLHLPPWDQARFERSGLDAASFRERYRVRTGHASLEMWAGGAFGDLDRYYDVRLAYQQDGDERAQSGVYQYSTFRNATGATFGATLAYAPISWAEAALSASMQLTRQEQVVGYEVSEDGLRVDGGRTAYLPGRSLLGGVEPAFRVLPVASGPLKPYVLAGLNLRFFPSYGESTAGGIDYPGLAGGVSLGPTLGLGLALDAGERGRGFLEIPWTMVLLPQETTVGAASLLDLPDEPLGVGQFLLFKAGGGIEF